MANVLTDIMPKILARGLLQLRETAIMPRLVNGDYSTEAKEFGDTIDVIIPASTTSKPVVPSNIPPVPDSKTPTKVPIPLDRWEHSDFHMTDKDMKEVDRNEHFLPGQAGEAIRALANEVNLSVLEEYRGIYSLVGTPGTVPFDGGTQEATQARKILNQQLCPKQMRRGVLDHDADASALEQAAFQDASKSFDPRVITEGEIGRKFGMDWFAEDNVLTHVAGGGSGYLVNNAATAIGDATLIVDTGTGTLTLGDIFTIAGDTQQYTVTAAQSGGAATWPIAPTLRVAVADDAVITIVNASDHVVNLAFHKDAFALAMRSLTSDMELVTSGGRVLSMQDPVTGLILRLEVDRQYKQVAWDFDILWGVKLVRPEYAVRIAG